MTGREQNKPPDEAADTVEDVEYRSLARRPQKGRRVGEALAPGTVPDEENGDVDTPPRSDADPVAPGD